MTIEFAEGSPSPPTPAIDHSFPVQDVGLLQSDGDWRVQKFVPKLLSECGGSWDSFRERFLGKDGAVCTREIPVTDPNGFELRQMLKIVFCRNGDHVSVRVFDVPVSPKQRDEHHYQWATQFIREILGNGGMALKVPRNFYENGMLGIEAVTRLLIRRVVGYIQGKIREDMLEAVFDLADERPNGFCGGFRIDSDGALSSFVHDGIGGNAELMEEEGIVSTGGFVLPDEITFEAVVHSIPFETGEDEYQCLEIPFGVLADNMSEGDPGYDSPVYAFGLRFETKCHEPMLFIWFDPTFGIQRGE